MIAISVALLITIAAAGTGLLWWGQERLVFQPGGPPYPSTGVTRLDYRADDGQPLLAYIVGNHTSPRGVLIAFHGNADLAVARVGWAEEVARHTGWLVMLPEWRGYAGLPGRPTADGVRRDARAALRAAISSLGAETGHIALYGHSLGSAVATELSEEANPVALVLESPLTSARDMARIVVARPVELVWSMISRVHYDTRRRVSEIGAPVSVAHGDRDFIIPVRMGEAVFAAARTKGRLLVVHGAGHNDVAEVAGDAYWQWITAALQ
ncbi:MAG: alpha/beta hydrolase [Gemmatimonadota bacterium]|nr:alpha/beta hydrolase [Gemmatimonadota bacterium]